MDTKIGCPALDRGKSSDDQSEFKSPESTKKEAISKYKRIFQTWANKIAMLPCDITIALFATSLSTQQNGNGSFPFPVSSPYNLFFLMLMLGFYASVIGIILWPVFPKMARWFYLVSFLCMLLALTMFFASLLPSILQDVPWICLTFVLFTVFGLAVYEECPMPLQLEVVFLKVLPKTGVS